MRVCLACEERFAAQDWQCPACASQPHKNGAFLLFAPEFASAPQGFAFDNFEKLAECEAGNFWFRSRNRNIRWALRKFFPQARSILEIGCGTGYVLSELRSSSPDVQVAASDLYPQCLPIAARRVPDAFLFQMDARRIPFDSEFDLIGAFDVLEHIEEDEVVLAQMHAACKPGAGLLLTVPQHPWLWSALDEIAYHQRRYVRRELVAKVQAAGFEVLYCSSLVSILLPLLLVSRLHKRGSSVDPMAEFKISRFTNSVLEGLLGVESLLLRTGLSLPAGGSLLLVARRPVAA